MTNKDQTYDTLTVKPKPIKKDETYDEKAKREKKTADQLTRQPPPLNHKRF